MRGHIRKRGTSWTVVVDTGRDEQGRRQQKWQGGFRTRREAQAALTETLSRLDHGTFVAPSRQTLADYIPQWLAAHRGKVRATTYASYERNLRTHVIPQLGSRQLRSLTPALLNGFYADVSRRDGRGALSPRTVRYIHMILRRSLADAVKWGALARNPADSADPPKPGRPQAMKTWTVAELRAFLDHVREDRLFAAWLLLATTGLRRGELLALRWENADLEGGRVAIVRTLTSISSHRAWSEPKTDKGRRQVALDPATVMALRQHRARQLEERLAWGPAYQDNGLVFSREDGSALHPELFLRQFRNRIRAAALPRIRLHDLRHTYASLALQAGIHPKIVSERLGHATIAITLDTYSHVIPDMQQEAAERVAALVLGGNSG
jgi:integrase